MASPHPLPGLERFTRRCGQGKEGKAGADGGEAEGKKLYLYV